MHAAAAVDHDPAAISVSLANCAGTQSVIAAAERWRATLVYISGVTVIGRPASLPVTEDHSVDPPTAYHASKLYGEHLTTLARRRGMAAASLRLTAPVGPGMPGGRILSVFVERALAGEPARGGWARHAATGLRGRARRSCGGRVEPRSPRRGPFQRWRGHHRRQRRARAPLRRAARLRFRGGPGPQARPGGGRRMAGLDRRAPRASSATGRAFSIDDAIAAVADDQRTRRAPVLDRLSRGSPAGPRAGSS